MRNGKYGNELELILLLTENKNYTAQDLADKLGITRRNLYNYLEYLRFSGFDLCKSGIYYRLERSSPFLRKLRDNMTRPPTFCIFSMTATKRTFMPTA